MKMLGVCATLRGRTDAPTSVPTTTEVAVIMLPVRKSSKTTPSPTFGQAIQALGFNAAVKLLGKGKR